MFFLFTIWQLDMLKRIAKIIWGNTFEQRKKKLGLKFNPRFSLGIDQVLTKLCCGVAMNKYTAKATPTLAQKYWFIFFIFPLYTCTEC